MPPMYLSRITIGASEWSITATIDGVTDTVFLAAGSYYLDSTTSTESLRQAMDDALETGWAAENFTITYSMTSGKFAWACPSLTGTWAVAFNQTAFQKWVGHAGWGAVGVTPVDSDYVCAGAIFAGSGRAAYPGILRRTSGATVIAESGVVAHIGSGSVRKHSSWQHGFEAVNFVSSPLESGTWDDAAATTAWAWEEFWEHHCQTGEPFRYFTTTGLATSAYEDTYVLDGESYTEFSPSRVEEASDRYWQVRLNVAKYVVAT